MLNPIDRHLNYDSCVEEESLIGSSFEVLVKEETLNEKTKTVTNRIVTKHVNPKDNFLKFSVSDFYLENLIAAGAVDNLKSCQYGDMDVDAITNQINESIGIEE